MLNCIAEEGTFQKENGNFTFYEGESFYEVKEFNEKLAYIVFHEQGELNFEKQNYKEALKNYNDVICYLRKNDMSDPSRLLNAICGSMYCYAILNEDRFAKEAFEELVHEVSVLREKVEDIDWFQASSIYPIYIQKSNRYGPEVQSVDLPDMTSEEYCQLQCNGYSLAAAFACGKVPHIAVQAICYGCIFGLEQLCIRCCKGDGFWENCVKGLRRLFYDPTHPKNPAPHPYE